MPVQAELDSPRRVAAYLDEKRTELFVVDIEVVVVDVDRLVTVELELSVDLLPLNALVFSCATSMKTIPSRIPVLDEAGWQCGPPSYA